MELVVVRMAGEWTIMVDSRKRGRFDYEVDAVDAALRMADQLRATHPSVKLLLQDRFGEVRAFEDEPVRAA